MPQHDVIEGAQPVEDVLQGAAGHCIRFGPYCLTPGKRLLTRNGVPVDLGGRCFDLLAVLAATPGRVLPKRLLIDRVWPDVTVDEGSLRFHMAGLRRILGDGVDGARYIATQVGVGYAFVASVETQPTMSPNKQLDWEGSEAAPAEALAPPPLGRLPARLGRLIGRHDDLALLMARVPDTPHFTIVGAAGVGKTTLATELGHALRASFVGRVSFVDLGALEDPALIGSAIASALGILVQGEDPVAVILGQLRTQRLLLLLDNCEHLIDAVSFIVERIGEAAPEVRILATSRERLRTQGEHVHWLAPLACPEDTGGLSLDQMLAYPAIDLFVERACARNSTLPIDEAALTLIAAICHRLDGMALPIELAAVRAASHGLEATAQLVGEAFSLGWMGRRTARPRQQTLQATLDWSYRLLSEVECRTLERLSVFVGPFSFDAALEVVADGNITAPAATAAIDELTEKSLLAVDRGGDAGSYRLPEMTRAYARERLRARGAEEVNANARRHAVHLLRRLSVVGSALRNVNGVEEAFSRQLGNLRSALEWSFRPGGDQSVGVPLAAASAPVFLAYSLLPECRAWCARAIDSLDASQRGDVIELELQGALGLSLMFTRGNSEAVEAALRRALDIAIAFGDRWSQLRMLAWLQIFHERIGSYAQSLACAEMAEEVATAIGEREAVAIAASLVGISHHLMGDQPRARRELELSLRLSPPSERGRTIHYGFDHRNRSGIALARTLWLLGHADQARQLAAAMVQEASALSHPVTLCIALIWSLSILRWTGELELAERTLDEFAAHAELNALAPYVAAADGLRAELSIRRGDVTNALPRIEANLGRLSEARYDLVTTEFEIALAEGLLIAGRPADALDLATAAAERCTGNGELFQLPELLRIRAQAARLAPGGSRHAAEAILREALTCARHQGAAAWMLRIAIDLARQEMREGRTCEALALLKPLRAEIREGFDTADLVAADALLMTLAGADAEQSDPLPHDASHR